MIAYVTSMVLGTDEGNFLRRTVFEGETFTVFGGATDGCINESVGIALTESADSTGHPFFEFPRNAVVLVKSIPRNLTENQDDL